MTDDVKDQIIKWLLSDDTGASSKCMVKQFMGCLKGFGDYPHDPSDFGRCYRLLFFIPELKGRLNEMKEVNAQWCALVDNWNAIEEAYIEALGERTADRCYSLMKQALKKAEDEDKNFVRMGDNMSLRFNGA